MLKAVLLVEDNEDDVLLLKLAWKKECASASLQVARDGREALCYLRGEGKHADREKNPLPVLVLLDLKLPRVPGFEVLRQIRQDPALCQLVVVVLTSAALLSDIKRAYELGANSFLVKPSSVEDRKELVRRIYAYWVESNHPPPVPSAPRV
jgi:CheY-like chemotaxis protein